MTLGRPPSIPMDYNLLDLPQNQNLDEVNHSITAYPVESNSADVKTVSFFIATMSGDVYPILHMLLME